MSHLTVSPFHKPSPFDVSSASRAHPLTPPDTESEFVGQAQAASGSAPAGLPIEYDQSYVHPPVLAPPLPLESDSPGTRFRRVSTLAYRSSGLRESSRDRGTRSSKSLIVVFPPTIFSQEHGQLGHTLSSGPSHRLNQGILMPLFPTMYGQLAAISREFNFPSTTGICLYLHISEGGATMTPRISDESWPFLWAHVFDAPSPSTPSQTLPISGRLEFDIDLRKARWYDAWISASQREAPDVPLSVASRPPSTSHTRGDSRTTFITEDQGGLEQLDSASFTQQSKTPTPATRHVPRKLSLVDRFESFSFQNGLGIPSQVGGLPSDQVDSLATHALAPITQEEEPKTATQDLQSRVNNWRASASLAPTPLAAKGQTSLEPANMPNTVILDSTISPADVVESALNFDDFTWSLSSAGPQSVAPDSPLSWGRLPSVHLDRRIQGSVCLTPTTCTSFGPFDYDLYSPVPTVSPLPSPDLGMRILEDAPPTPSTATSWGPASYPSSVISNDYRPPSVDIGHRAVFSRPGTPSTATSWGPASWPTSPASEYRTPSVDLGQRSTWSRPASPSIATPSSYPPSPNMPYYVHTPDAGQGSFDMTETVSAQAGLFAYDAWKGTPWRQVWPYTLRGDAVVSRGAAAEGKEGLRAPSVQLLSTYPRLVFYPAVYPHFDLYPSVSVEVIIPDSKSLSTKLQAVYPTIDLYPVVYPHLDIYPAPPGRHEDSLENALLAGVTRRAVTAWRHVWPYHQSKETVGAWSSLQDEPKREWTSDRVPSSYPHFVIYRAVYAHFDFYPDVAAEGIVIAQKSTSVRLPVSYPIFDIYPAVYPHFEIFPTLPQQSEVVLEMVVPIARSPSVRLPASYPVFDIYPAVYPYFDIFPTLIKKGQDTSNTATLSEKKSPIVISLRKAYPSFDIYPSTYPKSLDEIYPIKPRDNILGVQSTRLHAKYPVFDIYPSVYSAFHIYPGAAGSMEYPHQKLGSTPPVSLTGKSLSVHLAAYYPNIALYPAAYPYFDLYPALSAVSMKKISEDFSASSNSSYPIFNLYPAVYPHFDLYPATLPIKRVASPSRRSKRRYPVLDNIAVNLAASYPVFHLYPPVYPYFDIYHSGSPKTGGDLRVAVTVKLLAKYPLLDIYPPVYPYFDIYHPGSEIVQDEGTTVSVNLTAQYPAFNIYPPVYPYFDIYQSGSSGIVDANNLDAHSPVYDTEHGVPLAISVKLPSQYPTFNIYPSVYPYFDIYQSGASYFGGGNVLDITVKFPVQYPRFQIYPPVYPYFELWPSTSVSSPPTGDRGTHADLVASVMMEGGLRKHSPKRKSRKTHHQLHVAVFPSREGLTPLSTMSSLTDPNAKRQRTKSTPDDHRGERPPHPLRRKASLAAESIDSAQGRSRAGSINSARPLPTPPSANFYAPQRSPTIIDTSDESKQSNGRLPAPRTYGLPSSPSSPKSSSASRRSHLPKPKPPPTSPAPPVPPLPEVRNRRVDRQTLPPVQEKRKTSGDGLSGGSALNRAKSDSRASPLRLSGNINNVPDRSEFMSEPHAQHGPRKRTSLVLQRVMEYDASASSSGASEPTPITMEALSRFPMPPRPPMPPGPSVARLDRSKFPFI